MHTIVWQKQNFYPNSKWHKAALQMHSNALWTQSFYNVFECLGCVCQAILIQRCRQLC